MSDFACDGPVYRSGDVTFSGGGHLTFSGSHTGETITGDLHVISVERNPDV